MGRAELSVLAPPPPAELHAQAVRTHLSDLVRLGCCIPPANGELIYVDRPGAKLESVARAIWRRAGSSRR